MRIADRFAAPVGTALERMDSDVLGGNWYCSNPFQNYYALKPGVFAYHTGADILLWPGGGAHEPIYACASGLVTFARRIPTSTWGNVVVIGHTLPNGKELYSRYGHVENMLVKAGDEVWCGQQIASEGNAFGQFPYHLHFDISYTRRLLNDPSDWPGLDRTRLERDYIDPLAFLEAHAMQGLDLLDSLLTQAKAVVQQLRAAPPVPTEPPKPLPTPDPASRPATVNATNGLKIRTSPDSSMNLNYVITLANGTALNLFAPVNGWCKISGGVYDGDYVFAQYVSFL